MEDQKTKNVELISTYDQKGLKGYFEKYIPDPRKSLSWKTIVISDRMMDHKFMVVRFFGYLFGFLVSIPVCQILEFLEKRIKRKFTRPQR